MPRTRIEYGGCSQLKRSRPRRSAVHWASTIMLGLKVEEPMVRTLPARTRSVSAPSVSSMSVSSSGRWIWYRSIQSVCSRRRLASHSLAIQRRLLPNWLTSSPMVPWTFVARTTSSRRPLSALPTISSDSPREYTSAVSMKLIPASSARWMIRIDSSWSWLPQSPNIMAPRQSGLTCTPVRASVRCSMCRTLARRHELLDERGGPRLLVEHHHVAGVGDVDDRRRGAGVERGPFLVGEADLAAVAEHDGRARPRVAEATDDR